MVLKAAGRSRIAAADLERRHAQSTSGLLMETHQAEDFMKK
jgi:hypothetical protein